MVKEYGRASLNCRFRLVRAIRGQQPRWLLRSSPANRRTAARMTAVPLKLATATTCGRDPILNGLSSLRCLGGIDPEPSFNKLRKATVRRAAQEGWPIL